MALIKCYECSKEISDKAIACPHCGAPEKTKDNKSENRIFNISVFNVNTLSDFALDYLKFFKEKIILGATIGVIYMLALIVIDGPPPSDVFLWFLPLFVIYPWNICCFFYYLFIRYRKFKTKSNFETTINNNKISIINNTRMHLLFSFMLAVVSALFLSTLFDGMEIIWSEIAAKANVSPLGAPGFYSFERVFIQFILAPALILSLVSWIVYYMINKESSYLKALFRSLYLISLFWIIYSLAIIIKSPNVRDFIF